MLTQSISFILTPDYHLAVILLSNIEACRDLNSRLINRHEIRLKV